MRKEDNPEDNDYVQSSEADWKSNAVEQRRSSLRVRKRRRPIIEARTTQIKSTLACPGVTVMLETMVNAFAEPMDVKEVVGRVV